MLIKDRYEVIKQFETGGQAETFLAKDRNNDQKVIVKKISVTTTKSWKSVELFERESKVLKMLNHKHIPKYIDNFHIEEGGELNLFIVQEYIKGKSLDNFIKDVKLSKFQLYNFTIKLLSILNYLHNLVPPIIHRDIKPSNIIVSDSMEPYLIDFGAVYKPILKKEGGSTIVGTIGYMPSEQLMGKASEKSDLYAVGAVMLYLLTGKEPSELPMEDMEIKYKEVIEFDKNLNYFLDNTLAVKESQRFSSAEEAIEVLKHIKYGGSVDKFIKKRDIETVDKDQKNKNIEKIEQNIIEKFLNKKIIYIFSLIAGVSIAVYIYLLNFDRFSETELIEVTPYWVFPASFGYFGLSTSNKHRYIGAIKGASITMGLLILFIQGIFPSL